MSSSKRARAFAGVISVGVRGRGVEGKPFTRDIAGFSAALQLLAVLLKNLPKKYPFRPMPKYRAG
jgi:hypothetical protein